LSGFGLTWLAISPKIPSIHTADPSPHVRVQDAEESIPESRVYQKEYGTGHLASCMTVQQRDVTRQDMGMDDGDV